MGLLFQVFQFLVQPFTWFWTALVLGILIGLPDNATNWLTGKKNGLTVILILTLVVMLFTGVFDTSGIRSSNQLGGALAYVLHPFTLVWTLIVITIIVAIPDTTTSKWLKQDKAGYALALVAGTAILFLGPDWFGLIFDGSLILGIVIGIVGTVAYYRYKSGQAATVPIVTVPVEETRTTPRTRIRTSPLSPHIKPLTPIFTEPEEPDDYYEDYGNNYEDLSSDEYRGISLDDEEDQE